MKLLSINCPHCGEAMEVKKINGYEIAVCPECASQFYVQDNIITKDALEEERFKLISINCPNCGEVMDITNENGYDVATCPECATKFMIQKDLVKENLEEEKKKTYLLRTTYENLSRFKLVLGFFLIAISLFLVYDHLISGKNSVNLVKAVLSLLMILLSYMGISFRVKDIEKKLNINNQK